MSTSTRSFGALTSVGARAGTIHLRVSGPMGHDARSEIDACFAALALREPMRIVIDCSRVTFVDGGGLGALAAAISENPATTFELRSPSAMLRRLLTICGMDDRLVIS